MEGRHAPGHGLSLSQSWDVTRNLGWASLYLCLSWVVTISLEWACLGLSSSWIVTRSLGWDSRCFCLSWAVSRSLRWACLSLSLSQICPELSQKVLAWLLLVSVCPLSILNCLKKSSKWIVFVPVHPEWSQKKVLDGLVFVYYVLVYRDLSQEVLGGQSRSQSVIICVTMIAFKYLCWTAYLPMTISCTCPEP